ncbi:MAG: class I SAM-dependent methyltransferase [Planctomycetes bacterium]|nr:class I SAM-dependent methyltransferase [Planctomycetota bacterium]
MDLRGLLTPADPTFEAEARRIHAERPDVAAAVGAADGLPYRKWLAVFGAAEYPERIGRFFPPVPPQELYATGCAGGGLAHWLTSGLDDFEKLGEIVSTYGTKPFDRLDSVLDFGCGSGRVLRWFRAALPGACRFGIEVYEPGLRWCREQLGGEYVLTDGMPPVDLPDDSVDLVCAYSVFTHLDLAKNLAWLRELARICKSDGLLVLTTIGAYTLFVVQRSVDHQNLLAMPQELARDHLRRLAREPFLYHDKPADPRPGWGQGCPVAFFGEPFVRDAWGPVVEVLGHLPAVQDLWQDAFVLRPRRGR